MSLENFENRKFVVIKPAVKWFFKFIPIFLLSHLIFGLASFIDKIKPNIQRDDMELGLIGKAAFVFYEHSIEWGIFSIIFAFIGIIVVFILQSHVKREGAFWEKISLIRHTIYEHISEILMLLCGAFLGLGLHEFQIGKLTFKYSFGLAFVMFFTMVVSYSYFFVIENENRLQEFILEKYYASISNCIKLFGWLQGKIQR
jgi:hypothetical protein